MPLKAVFVQGVEIAFNTFNDAVKQAEYVVIDDSGFEAPEETKHNVRTILDKWGQEDVTSSLFPLVQPTDVKALIPGKDLTVPMKANQKLKVENRTFTIVDFETDPYNVLFTLLVRDA